MLRIASIEQPTELASEVAEVYRSAFSVFRDAPTDREVAVFAGETLGRHASREAFRFVAALEGERLIGFIYGYHGRPGEWWEEWIRERLPGELFERWFVNQFDVTEFCVRAERHGEGIGSRLYDRLMAGLAGEPYDRAVLTTRRLNNPARGFYLRRGWEVVWEALDARYSLLGLPLPAAAIQLP